MPRLVTNRFNNATNLTSGTVPWARLPFSGALVKKAADQTGLNASAFATISFDSEDSAAGCYDTDAYHDNSTNPDRLTVPAAGYYVVAALLSEVNLASGEYARTEILRFNSSSVQQPRIGLPTRPTLEVDAALGIGYQVGPSMPVLCAAGDYFTVRIDTEADTSIDLESDETWFAVHRVG